MVGKRPTGKPAQDQKIAQLLCCNPSPAKQREFPTPLRSVPGKAAGRCPGLGESPRVFTALQPSGPSGPWLDKRPETGTDWGAKNLHLKEISAPVQTPPRGGVCWDSHPLLPALSASGNKGDPHPHWADPRAMPRRIRPVLDDYLLVGEEDGRGRGDERRE